MTAGSELLAFAAKIGVDADQVKQAENIRDLHLVVDRPAQVFAALEPADYERLLSALDGALSLQIGLPNLPPLLSIDAGQLPHTLEDGVKALRGMEDGLRLRLNLSVAKGPLLAHWGLDGGELFLLPYLYTAAFQRLLGGDLLTLDRHLFAGPERATLVVLEDSPEQLSGRLLHVARVAGAARINAAAAPLSNHLRRRLAAYRATARETLSWSGFALKNITPAHLLVKAQETTSAADSAARRPAQTLLQPLLAAHAFTAGILFTANRSTRQEEGFEAVYAAADHTTALALPSGARALPSPGDLARWAIWPYGGDSGDRLILLQNVVARELRGDDAAQNTGALAGQMGHLLNEARWHYRVFLDREVDGHFSELQGLSDMVSKVTADVGAAIDSLTKGFVEALLGAVGVVVLTMLAALVEGQQPQLIIRAGLTVYAVYLLLFPGLYRMGSLWHSFRLLEAETIMRLAPYETRLGRQRVAGAQAALDARRRQFVIWFVITAVLMLLIALLLLFLAAWLPGWLGQRI